MNFLIHTFLVAAVIWPPLLCLVMITTQKDEEIPNRAIFLEIPAFCLIVSLGINSLIQLLHP
jgi:hypothetical protein